LPHVLVVNDYSLRASWDDVKAGRSPSHFLYGVDHLEKAGFDLTIISEEWSQLLNGLHDRLGRLRLALGNLDRQAAALRHLRRADAIYVPCQTQVQLLTYMRALGLFHAPITILAHHPLVRGRLGRALRPLTNLMLRGIAALPTLSKAVADEANRLVPSKGVGRALRWGPDAAFYPAAEYPGRGIVAAGRTGRDFVTFGRAATMSGVPATIVTPSAVFPLPPVGPNVTVIETPRFIEYSETTKMFASARALAIPMMAQDGLCGLTSLMDALGAGKPVIMTRNRNLDLDVESLGIGRWVEPGDVDGWVAALRFFDEHPDRAAEMGQRARRLVEQGLNYSSFSNEIVDIVRSTIRPRGSGPGLN
jgi:hypothetical protein